ncbi:MAG: hypothetical protein ABWX73_12630, partial [Marmoricola sp.]
MTRTRPRYARLAAAGSSVMITLVALLGGVGVLPTGGRADAATTTGRSGSVGTLSHLTIPDTGPSLTPEPNPESQPGTKPERTPAPTSRTTPLLPSFTASVPDDTGTGKRVVFDISDQRVWLVDPDSSGNDRVLRTYLVSGSVT